jgi:hypothetical protein
MATFRRLLRLPLLLALLGLPLAASAEQYQDFGDYRIHYSAFKSDMIAPEVAKAHGLTRSKYRAVINITVQKKGANGGYEAVPAEVEGTARDIYSKIRKLKMEEVREGPAIYYLAEFPITDEQRLDFAIRVIPQGEKVARPITFSQQFFVN